MGKYSFDIFTFENIQVERTRFGWPLKAITRDTVAHEFEWHIVLEDGWVAVNLFFLFLAWLFLQPVIGIMKWLFRKYEQAKKGSYATDTVTNG